MRALGKTGVVLAAALACGMAIGCGRSTFAPTSVMDGPVPTLAAADPAAVLLVDDFDGENNGVGVYDWKSFANWNVLAGCVDLHGNGFHDVQPGQGLYVDLDGSCSSGGTIESKTEFALDAGTYVLEFWIAGNQRISNADTVIVTLGALHEERMVVRQFQPFQLETRNITVPSQTTARLRFQNLGGDGRGALLDLVRLRRAQ